MDLKVIIIDSIVVLFTLELYGGNICLHIVELCGVGGHLSVVQPGNIGH